MAFNKDTIKTLLGIQDKAGILDSLKSAVASAGSLITNWNVAGFTRELAEMITRGVDDLNTIVVVAISAGFWETAEGAWLTQLAADRGCPRKLAQKTQGYIRASRLVTTSDVAIKAGTRIKTRILVNGKALHFIVDSDMVLVAGVATMLIPATAAVAGTAYNVAPGTITEPLTYVSGIDSWTNEADWIVIPGTDDETDDALRARGRLKWSELAQFSIASALRSLALSNSSVVWAQVLDQWERGQGTVDVVIATPTGAPSPEVTAAVQTLVDSKELLCTDVLVRGPVSKPVTLVGQLYCEEGTDLAAAEALEAAAIILANAYAGLGTSATIARLGIGEPLVRARLVSAWLTLAGVHDAVITTPTANVTLENDELIELASVDINVFVWSSATAEWVQLI